MGTINNIGKQVFATLIKNNIEALPNEYEREFIALSNKMDFISKENKLFKTLVTSLSKDKQKEIQKNKITTFKDLAFFITENQYDNLDNLTSIIIDSLSASIDNKKNAELKIFAKEIKKTKSSIFDENIQNAINSFTNDRKKRDHNVYLKHTKKISKLNNLLNTQIKEILSINTQSSIDISKITRKLGKLEKPNLNNLDLLQHELEGTAQLMKENVNTSSKKFQKSQIEIVELKDKIELLEEELKRSQKENDIDHLTSLYTRKAYEKHAVIIDEQYKRNKTDFAIIFFDIDYFKKVNDNYGHECGDTVLSTFSKILLKGTRDTDIVGRYGGEEFVGLLYCKDESEIEVYIKRIKKIVNNSKFIYKEHRLSISFSAGVTIRSMNKNYTEAINLSDKLLYKAKNTGRNKILFQSGLEI